MEEDSGGWGALDICRCTNLRRFIFDCTNFPINFTAALPMDLSLIWPELVDEIRVEIKGRKYTLMKFNNTVLISMALEGGGGTAPSSSWLGGGGGAHAPGAPLLLPPMQGTHGSTLQVR